MVADHCDEGKEKLQYTHSHHLLLLHKRRLIDGDILQHLVLYDQAQNEQEAFKLNEDLLNKKIQKLEDDLSSITAEKEEITKNL